jgi:ABC-type lipoprotein export system ATPase subunit
VNAVTAIAQLHGAAVAIGGSVALPPVDVDVVRGEVVVLHGPSGCGKTTLLGLLAGWLEPTSGRVTWHPPLDGVDRTRWHRTAVVPQLLGLLPELSLLENVALAPRLGGAPWAASVVAARGELRSLGIEDLADRRPDEASLGQQQRAAVARALVLRPPLVLADEPTSHLDAASADLVLDRLVGAAADGAAVVLASHDPAVLARSDRTVALDRVATR